MFEQIKAAGEMLKLVADLQNTDADKDGQPDLRQFMIHGAHLATEVADAKEANEKVMARLNEMGELLGKDIAVIRERFGIPEVRSDAS